MCTRVPEEKSYMILPEIEEEEEEGQKLSLTSLLLGDTHQRPSCLSEASCKIYMHEALNLTPLDLLCSVTIVCTL